MKNLLSVFLLLLALFVFVDSNISIDNALTTYAITKVNSNHAENNTIFIWLIIASIIIQTLEIKKIQLKIFVIIALSFCIGFFSWQFFEKKDKIYVETYKIERT